MSRKPYRLVGRLETGALAELYKGVRNSHENVVVKLFLPTTSAPEYARELADTSRALSGIRAPGILHEIEIGMVQHRLAVIREAIEGFNLGTALQRLSTKEVVLPLPVAIYLMVLLLEAVQQAHQAGVVHGAITPGNVNLARDGRVAICDFGALRALQAAPALKSFLAKGRSAYRAPELGQGMPTSELSDVYSLGAIAYELLTLREAMTSKGEMSTRRDAIPPPSRLDRRINTRLDAIVMRAIESSPQRRYKSCAEMAGALRNFLAENGGMPAHADVERLVTELYPSEVTLTLGPVPFEEAFALEEVRGADLHPDVTGEVALRQSFSGGAIPDGIAATPPQEEPNFEEGTQPGTGGSTDLSWDAPAAQMPAAPAPRNARQAGPPRAEARRGRVRRMEDLEAAEPDAPAPAVNPTPARAVGRPAPPPPKTVPQLPLAETFPHTGPVLEENVPSTREQAREARQARRSRLGWVAAAVALAGVLSMVVFVKLSGLDAHANRAGTPAGPIPGQLPGQGLVPPPTPQRIEPSKKDEPTHPPAPPGSGFLTIDSNVKAWVTIDGTALRRTTPLKEFPVEPGKHKITLKAVHTAEPREFTVTVVAGKTEKVEESFKPAPHR